MATLYISEFSNLAFTSNGTIDNAASAADWIADQTVAIGVSSAPSNPFNASTAYVLVAADHACSIAWTPAGASVNAATASDMRIAANGKPQMFGVTAGMVVSVITNS